MTMGEVKNPRKSMAKAVRLIFYRIFTFYILGITCDLPVSFSTFI